MLQLKLSLPLSPIRECVRSANTAASQFSTTLTNPEVHIVSSASCSHSVHLSKQPSLHTALLPMEKKLVTVVTLFMQPNRSKSNLVLTSNSALAQHNIKQHTSLPLLRKYEGANARLTRSVWLPQIFVVRRHRHYSNSKS